MDLSVLQRSSKTYNGPFPEKSCLGTLKVDGGKIDFFYFVKG